MFFSCKYTWEMQFRNVAENIQLFKKFHRCNISQKRRINVGPVCRDFFSPVPNCPRALGYILPGGHHQPTAKLSSLHDASTSEAFCDILVKCMKYDMTHIHQ